jgi:N-methylhydantoinase B/oxoprolinase/acetone carboxylase alpha subunit
VELSVLPGHPAPLSVFVDPDRMRFAPPGLAGGGDGPLKTLRLNGRPLALEELAEGRITLASPADRLEVWNPGGAGYGPAEQRDLALRASDEESGLSQPSPSGP